MLINVTQAHIDKALEYQNIRMIGLIPPGFSLNWSDRALWTSFSCPIALAATEAYGTEAQVDGTIVNFESTENHVLPNEAREFAKRFDLGYAIEPFSFELVI
jgi:hypothetical protein